MKKERGLLFCVIILGILVLTLGGYIIFNQTDNKNNDNKAIEYKYSLGNRKNVQALQQEYTELLVDLNGDVYLSIIGNTDYIENEQIKNNLKSLENSFSNYNPKGYLDYTGQNSIYKSRKLDTSNVLTIYNVSMGNAKIEYIIFLKEEGTLSYLIFNYESGTLPIYNIDGLNNIVSIVENSYTKTPYAIDMNGTEYSLYEYIK